VNTSGITDGLDVLDLGSGDGTTALPAAKLGANVLGVDIASNLVEAGNARARSLGLSNIRFQEGDASDLHELADDSFDLVVTIFGAMFAPKPFDVAEEIVERFTAAGVPGENISFERDTYTFNFQGPPSEFLRLFKNYYGPTMNAFEAGSAAGREPELERELGALFESQNESPTPMPPRFRQHSCG
jgi:ubiquinone/menaquinone biosynthesis C-methylase UbiE